MLIGLITGHDERLHPQAEDARLFFDALALEPARAELVRLDEAVLSSYDALFLGAPRRYLRRSELQALQVWLEAGGRLLMVGAMGGDRQPEGDDNNATNLGDLVPGLANDPLVLVAPGGGADPYSEDLLVDIGGLVGEPARLTVRAGGLFRIKADRAPRERLILDPPKGAMVGDCPRLYDGDSEDGGYFETAVLRPINELRSELEGEDLAVYLEVERGKGRVLAFAAVESFLDQALSLEGNLKFLNGLIGRWLPGLLGFELGQRMSRPQRHRLLNGYPMSSVLLEADRAPPRRLRERDRRYEVLRRPSGRGLQVGVLPHSFCNPAVRGCGFCTFPQERYRAGEAGATIEAVARELRAYRERRASEPPPVRALYFGGGTANLSPQEPFEKLCDELAASFELSGAEISLEGVPAYFQGKKASLLDAIEGRLAPRHLRLSMGVQTFDPAQLKRMGREAFGREALYSAIVRESHARGMTCSADMLINLPGQSLEQMRADIRRAAELGFDQLCVYHLVLYDGLGTEWSKDPALLGALPANERACEHWLQVRQDLLDAGFVQSTLTNFERAEMPPGQCFRYEPDGFCPERFDLLGFGPNAQSFFADDDFRHGLRLLNPELSEPYRAFVEDGDPRATRFFVYGQKDLAALYLTRKLALLKIDLRQAGALGIDPALDFPEELAALLDAGLLRSADGALELTPRGMFYADSAAGLLAWRRIQFIKARRLAAGLRPRARRRLFDREFDEAAGHSMG